MKEELKQFDIDLDKIPESNDLFDNIHEAINKMRLYTLANRFEVVLNNNLIESKEKLTNYRTILGCRISYDNLSKDISFIVREDTKPTYEQLEREIDRLNNIISELEETLEFEKNDYGSDLDIETRNIDSEFLRGNSWEADYILNKLKELKEGNKNE